MEDKTSIEKLNIYCMTKNQAEKLINTLSSIECSIDCSSPDLSDIEKYLSHLDYMSDKLLEVSERIAVALEKIEKHLSKGDIESESNSVK